MQLAEDGDGLSNGGNDMKTKILNHPLVSIASIATLSALLIVALTAGVALAQTDDGAQQAREREQIRDNAQDPQGEANQERKQIRENDQDPQGEALRERIRERIEGEEGLQEQERERLRQHLGECRQLGLDDETVAALFAENEPLRKQIRMQERVLEMAREGLPHEPVMQKLREGRRKGVGDQALERVCEQMEAHVRAANRVMEKARQDGLKKGDADAERRRTREMAMNMWHGLSEEECDQLRERARLRLRDGSCTTEDLTASGETAAKLREMGVARERAMHVAGDALQYGYTAREMRQLGWMVMTANAHGGPRDEVLDALERGIRSQRQLADMSREMWQRGWMGPADEHGGHHGGNMMNDGTGGGPGGHPGGNTGGEGHQNDGGTGGMGGGGQQGGTGGTGGGQQGGTGGSAPQSGAGSGGSK